MTKIKLAAAAVMAVMMVGCAPPGFEPALHVRPAEEAREVFGKGRLYRGYVFHVVSDSMYQKFLNANSEDIFLGLTGMTKQQAKDKRLITITWREFFGGKMETSLLIDRDIEIDEHDIVDFRHPVFSDRTISEKEAIHGKAPFIVGDLEFMVIQQGSFMGDGEPGELLGIVCRAGEPGCEVNSSPGTTIGIGRELPSIEDYRGVEAESGQEMLKLERNSSEFLVW